jgi:6-phosphogluconolactonase
VNLTHLDHIDELTERGATIFAQIMSESIAARGRFLVALSGGNTPKPVYQRLAQEPYFESLDWSNANVYFGDERMVPADDPESNYHMASETLLNHVAVEPSNIHRIEGELVPPVAAQRYDQQLHEIESGGALPRFDLILLGLGPDGHTASLFPGTDALENHTDYAAAVHLPDTSPGIRFAQDRVTLTYPVIDNARSIVFLVSGSDKAEALARIARGDRTAPAARVHAVNGTVEWLVVQ